MKVLIDTCVFADQVCSRQPFDKEANIIFSMAYAGHLDLLILPTSFATCSYIASRQGISPDAILSAYSHILNYCTLATTSKTTMRKAIKSKWKDFEDAIQFYTAVSHKADAIITRNKKDFALSSIPVFTPEEFVNQYVEED